MAFKSEYPNCRQFWQKQARSQVLRFGEQNTFYGEIFLFLCLKQIFQSTKFRGHKKYLGVTSPEYPPRVCGPGGRTVAGKSSIEDLHVFAGVLDVLKICI